MHIMRGGECMFVIKPYVEKYFPYPVATNIKICARILTHIKVCVIIYVLGGVFFI